MILINFIELSQNIVRIEKYVVHILYLLYILVKFLPDINPYSIILILSAFKTRTKPLQTIETYSKSFFYHMIICYMELISINISYTNKYFFWFIHVLLNAIKSRKKLSLNSIETCMVKIVGYIFKEIKTIVRLLMFVFMKQINCHLQYLVLSFVKQILLF